MYALKQSGMEVVVKPVKRCDQPLRLASASTLRGHDLLDFLTVADDDE